jgi:hypothetical protein
LRNQQKKGAGSDSNNNNNKNMKESFFLSFGICEMRKMSRNRAVLHGGVRRGRDKTKRKHFVHNGRKSER